MLEISLMWWFSSDGLRPKNGSQFVLIGSHAAGKKHVYIVAFTILLSIAKINRHNNFQMQGEKSSTQILAIKQSHASLDLIVCASRRN